MIAQVVFDLPLAGPFDYSIPSSLAGTITVGMRVKVSFGPRAQTGYVVGLLDQSTVTVQLKPIQGLRESSAVFNALDLNFAREFSAYYGCSLGEALATMLRHKDTAKPSVRREHRPAISLYRCPTHRYADRIREVLKNRQGALVLVPDIFRQQNFFRQVGQGVRIGMRSSVFDADGRLDCVIMVDEEDDSYKQEQMPMYETRQVLLTRARMYGFDVVFIGVSPSVELMALVRAGGVQLIEEDSGPAVVAVDLSNYKFLPGMISPPVRDAMDAALKSKQKSLLVLNRRGSYRVTRCVDCSHILKCDHCDSPLIYSRAAKKFLCRHCTYSLPGGTVCPHCQKPSWRSVGMGVEQLQTELRKYFPQAAIISFERENDGALKDFDILIATRAVLRFQGQWQAFSASFIDFDAELNRLDMRSSLNAFSFVRHISGMAKDRVFIQGRNTGHYVVQCLLRNETQRFYDEELKLRKEFGFSPFKHWIKLTWRAKTEKAAQDAAGEAHRQLSLTLPEGYELMPPLADAVAKKRGQFFFNVMVQADEVPQAVTFIKSSLGQIKRPSRVILTINIDP